MKHKALDGQVRRIAVAASVWALAMVPAGAAQVEVSNPGTTVSKDADPSRRPQPSPQQCGAGFPDATRALGLERPSTISRAPIWA